MLARAGTRPQVDMVFPFDQLPPALERLARGPMGKVLVAVRSCWLAAQILHGITASSLLVEPKELLGVSITDG